MFDFSSLAYDADGDGVADSIAETADFDGDGTMETILLSDLDGDGLIDSAFIDTTGDGIADTQIGMETVDVSGDGLADSVLLDTDGDGIADLGLIDADGDGTMDYSLTDEDHNGELETVLFDEDNNGIPDSSAGYTDEDGDGNAETYRHTWDRNQDGIDDEQEILVDTDGDGSYDVALSAVDTDDDGILDQIELDVDTDGDGESDAHIEGQILDTDGDGVLDTYIQQTDSGSDGIVDREATYQIDSETGELTLTTLQEESAVQMQTASETWDPDTSDPDAVVGDPENSMEEWEYQGDTGRCALYSQKFVIEELTDLEIDIEEMADIAEENGWFSEESGTGFLSMNQMLTYYGIDSEMSFHNGISDIEACLNSGGKVIVSLDSGEIWYGETDDLFLPTDGADHAVEVIGVDYTDPDNPMVILNDSGTLDGCGELVPLDTFLDAWEDGGCQMITVEA